MLTEMSPRYVVIAVVAANARLWRNSDFGARVHGWSPRFGKEPRFSCGGPLAVSVP